jgi:hypothetical protein
MTDSWFDERERASQRSEEPDGCCLCRTSTPPSWLRLLWIGDRCPSLVVAVEGPAAQHIRSSPGLCRG